MRDDNYYRYTGPGETNSHGKLRPDNFFQKNRWFLIIITALIALVAIFGYATFSLLASRQGGTATSSAPAPQNAAAAATSAPTAPPQATVAPALGATVTSPAQAAPNTISPSTKNYQFVCIDGCDSKVAITLNDVTINTTTQTMTWDFTIANNGDVCGIYGTLSLQSPDGNSIDANGGTFTSSVEINSAQTLPRTATFSSLPHQGVAYTTTLHMYCNDYTTYQSVLFSY